MKLISLVLLLSCSAEALRIKPSLIQTIDSESLQNQNLLEKYNEKMRIAKVNSKTGLIGRDHTKKSLLEAKVLIS